MEIEMRRLLRLGNFRWTLFSCTSVVLAGVMSGGWASTAQGALLLYEPFNYTTGTLAPSGTGRVLNGQAATGLGLTGSWSTTNNNGAGFPVTVYPYGTLSGVKLNDGSNNLFNDVV